MASGVNVTVKLAGVREEHLPRLMTAIKSHIQKFGRTMTVDVEKPEPAKKPRKGK